MGWLAKYETWVWLFLVVGGFVWLTRVPELRLIRFRLGASLLIVVAFFFFARGVWSMVLLLLLARPVFFVFGMVWSEVVAHFAFRAFHASVMGDGGPAGPMSSPSYALARHFRATGRTTLAIRNIKDRMRNHPEDFEGLYLLALIHAQDLRDLKSARHFTQLILNAEAISHGQKEYAALEYERWRLSVNPGDATAIMFSGSNQPAFAVDETSGKLRLSPKAGLSSGLAQGVSPHPGTKPRQFLDGILASEERKPPGPDPDYNESRRLRHAQKPKSAIALAERQLKMTDAPFEGMLLVATIYAEDLHDLAGAQTWINKILDLDFTRSGAKEYAKNQLAEWQSGKAAAHGKFIEVKTTPGGPVVTLPAADEHETPPRLKNAGPVRLPPHYLNLEAWAQHADFQEILELRANGQFGSALELTEKRLLDYPGDYATLQLIAAIQAEDCANYWRAQRLVEQIERQNHIPVECKERSRAWLQTCYHRIQNVR